MGAPSPKQAKSISWRRRRDSNPRYAFRAYNGLANRRLQPLGHVSVPWICLTVGGYASKPRRRSFAREMRASGQGKRRGGLPARYHQEAQLTTPIRTRFVVD